MNSDDLDLVGPIDTFTAAAIQEGEDPRDRTYQTVIIGLTTKPFTSECGSVNSRMAPRSVIS